MKLNFGGREIQVDSRLLLSVLLLLTNAACSERASDSDPPPTQAKSDSYFEIGLGDRIISIQLAVTPSEMERGLMFRKSLDPNQGMLFVYRDARQRSFWMRNTSIPLDIGFFSREDEKHALIRNRRRVRARVLKFFGPSLRRFKSTTGLSKF